MSTLCFNREHVGTTSYFLTFHKREKDESIPRNETVSPSNYLNMNCQAKVSLLGEILEKKHIYFRSWQN